MNSSTIVDSGGMIASFRTVLIHWVFNDYGSNGMMILNSEIGTQVVMQTRFTNEVDTSWWLTSFLVGAFEEKCPTLTVGCFLDA